jgi:cell filamentation protein, protein adenylyltransferase
MPRGRPTRQQVFEGLDEARRDLNIIGGLPEPTVFQDVWADIWVEETHNSTAIEGNTLRRKQVQLLLEEGVVTGSAHELKEWMEAKAYGEAARWTYEGAYRARGLNENAITESDLHRIHHLTVESVWVHFPPEGLRSDEVPGGYRTGDIEPLRPDFTPPPPSIVPALVGDWIRETNEGPPGDCHLIEHLAERHAAFERIHPFPDGNGRAGRLVLTMLLVQNGYPPAIIYKGQRKRYLAALQRADNGDPGALAELLARSVREGIYRFLMPNLAGPLSVVPLAGLADEELSQAALVGAAQRGRLKANKYGGKWYSTRQWVDEYKASRQPGRALSETP